MNVCIIGASRGIGEALCDTAIAAGHTVWGVARDREALEHLVRRLPPGRFFRSVADIGDQASVDAWRSEMALRQFAPDIVILNASVQLPDLSESGYDHKNGRRMIDINLSGLLRCVEALLPDMLAKGHGTFVAVSSTAMFRPSPRSAAYSATKAGIAIAMRSFALQYARRGVRFKTVCLGPIATTMWEGKKNFLVPSSAAAAKAILSFAPGRRVFLAYPLRTTIPLYLTLWLPDAVFAFCSRVLLK